MRLQGRAWSLLLAAAATVGALGAGTAEAAESAPYRLGPAVRVSAMTAGPEGKLWFAGNQGVPELPAPIKPLGGVIGAVSPQGEVSEVDIGGGALSGIAVGADGAIWSTEPLPGRIVRVSTMGAVSTYAVPGVGAGAELSSIAAGPDGALWFTEGRRDEFARITTAGAVSEFPLPPGSDGRDIVAGSDGALWLAATGTDSIDRVATDGTVTAFPIGGGAENEPRSLALGPDGNVFFTQRAARIGRISPDGSVAEFSRPRPAGLIAAAGKDLWFTTRTRPYKYSEGPDGGIASMTTTGQVTAAESPRLPNYASVVSSLAAGPEGAPWFAQGTRRVDGGGASQQLADAEPIYVHPFNPPPLKVSVLGPVMVHGSKAKLDLLCSGGVAQDRCKGRLTLRAEGPGSPRLGSVRFDLRSGESRFLQSSLTPKARRLIDAGKLSRARVSSGFPLTGKRSVRAQVPG